LICIDCMHTLSDSESQTVDRLRLAYYEVVPAKFRTYCSLTSRITKSVLDQFGIPTELMSCQLWYTNKSQNFVVGFLNHKDIGAEWNGHVVCRAGNVIIDAATQTLEVKLGAQVPWVVVANRFKVSTQLISRAKLSDSAMLEWFYPPPNFETNAPEEPSILIEQYANLLVQRIS